MVLRRKRGSTTGNPTIAIAIGTATALILSVSLCAVISGLIHNENIPIQSSGTYVILAQGIGSLIGAGVACYIANEQRLITGLITAVAYWGCLIACTALFLDGEYRGVGISMSVILIAACVTALSGIRTKNRKYFKPRKRPYR